MGTVRIKPTTSERGEGKMEAYTPQMQYFTLAFAKRRGRPPGGAALGLLLPLQPPCQGQHLPPAVRAPTHLPSHTSPWHLLW